METLFEFQASMLDRAAADIATTTGPYDGLEVNLYAAQIDINQNTPLATFTAAVATYTGYAVGPITWDTPSISDDGIVEVIGTVPIFAPTGTTVTNDIWGLYILNGGGTAVYWAVQFDGAPLPMGATTDRILLTLRYRPATNSIVVTIS